MKSTIHFGGVPPPMFGFPPNMVIKTIPSFISESSSIGRIFILGWQRGVETQEAPGLMGFGFFLCVEAMVKSLVHKR